MMCSGFFLLITVWVFLHGWRLGRNAHPSHPNRTLCRSRQTSDPVKKGALLLRRMKETQSGFLGLNQGQHEMVRAGVGTFKIYLHACAARQKH